MSEAGGDSLPDELREAAVRHFRGESARPTAVELARYYRERRMMAVVFTVDSESFTGQTRVPNEEIAEVARANADVLIPFASIDPHKGRRGVDEARRLIADHGVRGFKFHPNVQGFFPNDRMAYPLYEVIEEAGLPALFHTGQSGVGTGLPGGGGIRLKYSNPIHVDDVAVDFPELKIVLAHPSFPWQDEALAVAVHKPQVYIDLSGWSPKYFPPQLVQHANTLLRERVLFGTDYPFITPERWLADFEHLDIKPGGAAADPEAERHTAPRPRRRGGMSSEKEDGVGYSDRWKTVRVELDDGIAWVELNRPEKRNAMNPALNAEMVEVLLALDADDRCGVVVLTGAGDAWSAGMDLKEYFREVDGAPEHVQRRVRRDAAYWQWRLLRTYAKPTIAMVNGWCFGGAFTPLVACDLAIAADEATFGLSEINWGIPPGSVVSKALADTVGSRAGLLYVMTGRTFDGTQAAAMGLVNASVPRAELRAEVESLARELLAKNPVVLRAAKLGYKHSGTMSWDQAEDYLYAKLEQSQFLDAERGREQGLEQFLDEKRIKPGLQTYERPKEDE